MSDIQLVLGRVPAETLNVRNNRSPGISASAYKIDCELPGVLMNAPHR